MGATAPTTSPTVPDEYALASASRDERGNSHAEPGNRPDVEYDTHASPPHFCENDDSYTLRSDGHDQHGVKGGRCRGR
eukprot:5102636-Pyramimonas_sp.AAC.1